MVSARRAAGIAAVVVTFVAVAMAWRSTVPTEVNAVITEVHCSWAPLRLGDIVVTGTAHNPSSRTRDFSLTPHFGLRGLGEQTRDEGSFVMPAEGSYRFWADVPTSRRSKPGGPISGCGASARSFTPSGD
jgi:hypothetical protein